MLSSSGDSHGQKDFPPDRMAAIMPASGGWFPTARGGGPGADQQLAPSTHIKLGRRQDECGLDDGKLLKMEITEKQRVIEALRALPEHATIDDAIERLCFIAKIEEGLRQSDARQLLSHDEVKKQFLS